MGIADNLTAVEVPFSSTVGKSVMFTAPGGACIAQIAIMVPSVAHDYREIAEAVATQIVAAWNRRAPVSAGKVKALAEAAIRDCEAGAPISAANLARDVLAALQPGDGWQNGQAAKAMLAHYAQEVRPHAEARGMSREAVRDAALASAGAVFDEAWPAPLPQGEETR